MQRWVWLRRRPSWGKVPTVAVLSAAWFLEIALENPAAGGLGGERQLLPAVPDSQASAWQVMWMVFARDGFACSAYHNKVKRQRSGRLDYQVQPPLAELLCSLPALLFVRPVRLPFLTAAFGRLAAPAFCRRAAWHRQRLQPRNRLPPQRVPPGPLPPDTARPGVPSRQAAVFLRGYAARQRASRCAAGALCLPYGRAYPRVSVLALSCHNRPLHKLVINCLKFLQRPFK